VTAHAIAGKVLKARVENPESNLSAVLAGAAMHTVGRPLLYSDEDLRRILSPRHFVNVRTTLGGPAPAETGRALTESVALLDQHHAWLNQRREALALAESRLRERAGAI
jgi:argininosuccinate lyase